MTGLLDRRACFEPQLELASWPSRRPDPGTPRGSRDPAFKNVPSWNLIRVDGHQEDVQIHAGRVNIQRLGEQLDVPDKLYQGAEKAD